jgi:glyoxylase-like metal-dependent hydrolase (beta-lactamase superfamily II)
LILTDHHPDHISGMKTFKDIGVKTIGHANLDLWLRENKTEGLREFISSLYNRWFKDPWTKEELNVIFGDVELSTLDQTVDKDKRIKIDDEEIHILCTPGHEKSCLSVYLPSSRILFAGDTVWGPRLDPAVRFGDKNLWRQWINSLERLSKLDIDCIVPGHGRLCDTKEIPRHIKYLEKWIAEA